MILVKHNSKDTIRRFVFKNGSQVVITYRDNKYIAWLETKNCLFCSLPCNTKTESIKSLRFSLKSIYKIESKLKGL